MRTPILLSALLLLPALAPARAGAQTFTRLTDPANPVVADPGGAGFAGVNWIDADEDGWPDLFVAGHGLYRNHGGGAFTRNPIPGCEGLGSSWADPDNDGDHDLMIVAGSNLNGGRFYRNDGGTFEREGNGTIGELYELTGWACAWGDYDADGRVDLVIAQAHGFTGFGPNRLLHNEGGLAFTRDFSTDVTASQAPHTVPSWADFDLDGDLDLSIGSGPVSTVGPDYFYRNTRVGGGAPLLDRITTGALATDLRDGQVVNWIDYDNDGDLDCYITNFNNRANDLYRNDGGTHVRLTVADVGPIVGDVGVNLASVWNDYDNDGDLDCFVTRNGVPCAYYRNEGNGTFTAPAMGALTAGPAVTAVAADYDRDGDVDLYVSAPGAGKGLYRNDLAAGNRWLVLRLTGTVSNRAAIGARARVRATIGGAPVWQTREVSAQNSFNGHSELAQHFGLGDAATIDSLVVHWPSGLVETFTGLPVDTVLALVEGEQSTATVASLAEARLTGRGVELAWQGPGLAAVASPVVERRAGAGAWSPIGVPAAIGADRLELVDPAPPGRWSYRLRFRDGDGETLTAESVVDVPEARLALDRLRVRGDRIEVTFALPREGTARIDVLDVGGRQRASHALGALGAGTHQRALPAGALAPGVYWVRLRHAEATASARIVLAR